MYFLLFPIWNFFYYPTNLSQLYLERDPIWYHESHLFFLFNRSWCIWVNHDKYEY